jgi:trans-aconitate methyltransferase
MRYQETWIKGCPTGEAFQRECASRYGPIKAVLAKYTRPFSVFDLGANLGYFSFRIAEDFPHATIIAVDNRKELPKLAKANDLPNVVVLPRRMTGDDITALARCEAFDVVLALNVLHHMPDWRGALYGLSQLAGRAIFETPGPGDHGALKRGDHGAIREAVSEMGEEIFRSPAHTSAGAERIMYQCDLWRFKGLKMQALDADRRKTPEMRKTVVYLTHEEAKISRDDVPRDFVPGMNLWNAHLMGMAWPLDAKDRIRREVARMEAQGRWHDDLRPWNFILSGDRAVAIDTDNKHWRKEPEDGALAKCMAYL